MQCGASLSSSRFGSAESNALTGVITDKVLVDGEELRGSLSDEQHSSEFRSSRGDPYSGGDQPAQIF